MKHAQSVGEMRDVRLLHLFCWNPVTWMGAMLLRQSRSRRLNVMRFFNCCAMAVLPIVLGGCLTHSSMEPASLRPEGWRQGWIKDILVGSQVDNIADRPCLSHLKADEIAKLQFAEVTFPRGRARGYRTLPLPNGSDLQSGDLVWFEVSKCSPPSKNRPEESANR